MSAILESEELWRRFFAGERETLPDIVRQGHADLLRRVRRWLARRYRPWEVDPHDICQRIYLTLWARSRPQQVRNIAAYLQALIRNATHSELRERHAARRDSRRLQSLSLADLAALPGSQHSPDPGGEWRSDWRELLSHTSQREQALLELVRAGLGWREIGQQLAITPNSARMRFSRAIDRLRRQRT